MADETKTLILDLQFNTEEGIQNAAKLRIAIEEDKKALAALNKTIKDNGEITLEQAEQREKLEKLIKDANKERATELKMVDNYLKATQGVTNAQGEYIGSIKQMRSSLSFLTEKWNDLTKEERENANIGGKLQSEIKKTSDELKKQEGSVGDTRRSVGDYKNSILDAAKGMGGFGKAIDVMGSAVKANPVGLLITALQLLPGLLNSSGEGADFFAKVMSTVNAVMQEGLKRIVALGGSFVKLISGDFKGALTDGKAAMSGFGDAIGNAVKAGGKLADMIDKLEVAESAFTVTNANTRKEIDALLIQAKNRTTAEGDRIKLLEKAEKLEVDLNKQALKLANDRLAVIKLQNKTNQEDSDEQQKRVNEQLVKISEIQRESQNIQEKIQVRKDAIADAAAAKEKARYDESVKQFEAKKALLIKEVEAFQKTIDGQIDAQAEKTEAEKKASEEHIKLIDAQFQADEKVRQAGLKADAEVEAQKKKDSEAAIKRKQDEQQALADFGSASSALAAALAKENADFAEFQKAVTLFQLGLASAEAISKGIAASQGIPFPGNLIATATTIASVSANLLQAKQLIQGDAPKPPTKGAEGGLLVGPSHASGGIAGTGSFAGIEVEGGEAIISKNATSMFAPMLSMMNQMGGGKPLGGTRYAATGGILNQTLPQSTRNFINNTGQGIDYNQLAKAMSNIPAPVLSIKTFEQKVAQRNVIVKQSTIGR